MDWAAASRSLASDSAFGLVGVHQRRDHTDVGQEVAQKPQAFRSQFIGQIAHARHVSTRPIETGDQAILDRVAADGEHDRDRCGRRFGDKRSLRGGHAGYDRDLTADEVGCERRQPIVLQLGKAVFDPHIAALDKAGLGETLTERRQTAAAPPSSVMNSRRIIIQSPRRRGRAPSAAARC